MFIKDVTRHVRSIIRICSPSKRRHTVSIPPCSCMSQPALPKFAKGCASKKVPRRLRIITQVSDREERKKGRVGLDVDYGWRGIGRVDCTYKPTVRAALSSSVAKDERAWGHGWWW
ncbi:hypothetical protein ONZ45_g2274 [Pleurotus djamor]|nr:hypothetical protein ONZ45_g2274 [Pleurotus djamor]